MDKESVCSTLSHRVCCHQDLSQVFCVTVFLPRPTSSTLLLTHGRYAIYPN